MDETIQAKAELWRNINHTIAETQLCGLAVASIVALLNEQREGTEYALIFGKPYRIEGKLNPSPHLKMIAVDPVQ